MKTLYLIRGLPGSGKSTFAKELARANPNCSVFENDSYHVMIGNGEYHWKPENVQRAAEWCFCSAEFRMQDGYDVIVSNTFTTEKEMKPYLELAKKYEYRVVSLIVENRHGNESVHNVPEETMQKMERRFSVKLRQKEDV